MQSPTNVNLDAVLTEIRRANGDTFARLTEDLGVTRAQLAAVTRERDELLVALEDRDAPTPPPDPDGSLGADQVVEGSITADQEATQP